MDEYITDITKSTREAIEKKNKHVADVWVYFLFYFNYLDRIWPKCAFQIASANFQRHRQERYWDVPRKRMDKRQGISVFFFFLTQDKNWFRLQKKINIHMNIWRWNIWFLNQLMKNNNNNTLVPTKIKNKKKSDFLFQSY